MKKTELKLNEYIKLGENSFLGKINSEGESEVYVFCVRTSRCEWAYENGLEIFGHGETAEEALMKGSGHLAERALDAIGFDLLMELDIKGLIDTIENKEGDIPVPEKGITVKEGDQNSLLQATFHHGKIYGLSPFSTFSGSRED